MLAKRIIPCLDVKDGKVVKGVQFKNLRVEGDPAKLAAIYEDEGADEIVLLDITASYEKREILLDVVERTADMLSIPFTVGGGIRSLSDIQKILCSGADKVSINTAAVRKPVIIKQASEVFGSQCVVVAIDAKRTWIGNALPDKTVVNTPEGLCWWEVYVEGGRIPTKLDTVLWARTAEKLGAGEILLTSMDYDGMQSGYDIALTRTVSENANLPIIASGGAGNLDQIFKVLTEGKADAALAASIFHRSQYSAQKVKEYLAKKGVCVRLI